MKTEARKSFDTGFVLTEEELRRIVNVARQQLEKAGVAKVRESLEVKFKNGTISDIGALDELLSLENVGSKEIIRLDILLIHEPPGGVDQNMRYLPDSLVEFRMPDHYISLQFRNAAEDDDPRPIFYNVRGTERDWVFVTASELDERVAKIKSRAPRRTLKRNSSRSFRFLLGVTLGVFLAILLGMPRSRPTAEAIESRWRAGTLRDPIEAIIIQQKSYEKDRAFLNPRYFLLLAVGIPIGFVAASELLLALLYYLYPAYVFSWGDKAKLYEKRVRIRGYVLTGILVALAISVIGSVIANRLTAPR